MKNKSIFSIIIGSAFILWGISIAFNISLPIFQITFAVILIYIGVKLIIKK